MRLLFRRGLLALALTLTFTGVAHAQTPVNASPVVQLVSYRDIYGKHIEMLGWGSASIINDKGIIISNNHVVDDGTGHLASAFSVCVTKQLKARPTCDYTASLIARDETMDISILKIDPKDVHGNAVDYGNFQKLDVDFDYTPTAQDDTVIIGYPWIGADTITETKGIVSGTTQYNGFQYIKSDAVIAGGNSGGAMINKAGKLIGIPTFTLGGFFDSSLGYALSIKEAKTFIQDNIAKAPSILTQHIDFAGYQNAMDAINKQHSVSDDLLGLTFSTDYEVSNYIRNRTLQLSPSSPKDIILNGMTINVSKTPKLEGEKAFLHYAESVWLYSANSTKLTKKTIGGLSFYTPISNYDPSQGETNSYTNYFTQLTPTLLLQISVDAPLYDEKNNQKVREEVERVLSGLTFTKTPSGLEKEFTFDLLSPELKVTTDEQSIPDDIFGSLIQFLGNGHEYLTLSLQVKDLYSGGGRSVEDLYAYETANMQKDYTAPITINGLPGYVACQASPGNGSPNAYIPYLYNEPSTDVNGTVTPPSQECYIRLLSGLKDDAGNEYFVSILVHGPATKISDTLEKAYTFLKENMYINGNTGGETVLVNPFNNVVSLNFKDIDDQSDEYRQTLKVLVKYGLLQNGTRFDPYRAMRWKDFLSIYLHALYNVDLTTVKGCPRIDTVCALKKATIETPNGTKKIYDILANTMKIDVNALVPQSSIADFDFIFRAHLADADFGKFSQKDIAMYQRNPSSPSYEAQYNALNALDTFLYGSQRSGINDMMSSWSSFSADKNVVFYPLQGLKVEENYNNEPYVFSGDKAAEYQYQTWADQQKRSQARYTTAYATLTECLKKKNAGLDCVKDYTLTLGRLMQEDQADMLSYNVLTRAQAYDFIMSNINFSLFDTALADKEAPASQQ